MFVTFGRVVCERSTYLFLPPLSRTLRAACNVLKLLEFNPVTFTLYGLSSVVAGWLESHVLRLFMVTSWAETTVMVGSLYCIVVPSFVSFSVKVSVPVAFPSKYNFVFGEPKVASTFVPLEMPAVNEQSGSKE